MSRAGDEGGLLRRPRVEGLLDAARGRRLTAVVAGAGFGKTTALSQAFGDRRTAWHTVTALDRSIAALVRSVITKLRLVVPGLSNEVLFAIGGGQGPDSGADDIAPEALAAALAQDLAAHLTRDLVFVVDGAHELDGAAASSQFLGALCRHSPARLHMVVASRTPLPFPIARMRLAGEAAEITADDLAFTRAEVDELAATAVGNAATLLAEVYDRTAGWPVAVVYAVEAVRHGDTIDLDDVLRGEALVRYLAEEVLGSSAAGLSDVLEIAAALPWVTRDLLAHCGVDRGAGALFDNSLPHLLLPVPESPEARTVAPILRGYLADHGQPSDGERQTALRVAAEWYEAEGHLPEALAVRRMLGVGEEFVAFLTRVGARLISLGLAREFVSALTWLEDRLGPDDVLDDDVVLLGAEARQILGDWEGAMATYRRLIPDDGPIPARIAWRFGMLHHMRGDVDAALATYRLGELDDAPAADASALAAWSASAYWLRGERDEAEPLAQRALALAQEAGAAGSLATAHTVLAMVAALDGDRAANDMHYLRALEHAETARDIVQTIRIRSNRGSHFLEEGDFDAALAELEIALRLADMSGFEFWRGMALSNRGEILVMRGSLDEAIADLTQARGIFGRIGSNFEAYPLAHLGDVYAMRGDTALAQAAYEESIVMADRQGDLQGLVPALCGLADLLVDDDLPRARDLVKRAVAVDSVIGRVRALVSAGRVALASGDTEEAVRLAGEAADVARVRRDFPGLADALELQGRCCPEGVRAERLAQAREVAEEVGMPVGSARVDLALAEETGGAEGVAIAQRAMATLSRRGAKGLAMGAAHLIGQLTDRDVAGVHVATLGGFRVSVGGDPVPLSAWQSKVARDLLAMLAAARGRRIHREVLVERLWPGEDPGKAGNRLSVALSTIRSVLDPDKRFDGGWFIEADRGTIALVAERVEVDVEVFLARVAAGISAVQEGDVEGGMAMLESAEAMYLGDFLEEQPYEEWTITVREEARTAYLTATSTLAEADVAAGDFDRAARRYLRILERDPYNEPAHLSLVRAMVGSGRHGAARRMYGTYVSRMREIEVEPEPFPA